MGCCLRAKYQVFKDAKGKYRFRLRASNNKIVAVSQAYESKAAGINGVKSVQSNCQTHVLEDKTVEGERLPDPKYEVFADAKLEFRFNLIAPNGRIIASSEAYKSKQHCLRGIEAVKNSCGAEIEDLTVKQVGEEKAEEIGEHVGIVESGIAVISPPNVVESGSVVTFEGWLMTRTGKGIEKAKVDIMESNRSFMHDKMLTSGVTGEDGNFNIRWKSYQQDWWDDTVEIYARFCGTEKYKPVRSATYRIRVV
jgi:uncharacterized protein YegP (UPF0339 family)